MVPFLGSIFFFFFFSFESFATINCSFACLLYILLFSTCLNYISWRSVRNNIIHSFVCYMTQSIALMYYFTTKQAFHFYCHFFFFLFVKHRTISYTYTYRFSLILFSFLSMCFRYYFFFPAIRRYYLYLSFTFFIR